MNVFELEGSISLDVNGFKKAVSDAKKQGQDLGKSFTDQSAAILDLQKEIERLSNDLTATKSEISRLKSEFDKAAKAADSNADSTSKVAKEAENASNAIDDEVKATEKSSNVNDALKDILERVSKSLDNMADVMSEVGKEEDTTAKKTDDYKDSARKAKDETGLFEKAARSLGEAAKDTAGKIGDLAGKVGDVLVGAAKAGAAAVGAASTAVIALTKASVEGYGEYEQLVGGAQKIFDEMDYSKIAEDAANAYKDLNLSASEYLESINLAGATFAQTMGDEKGYNTARKGMLAIADYASGTGKSITELNTKYQMITRAASSYQSIADQFSGVLPATSADFLEQAQAAGFLSETYEKLTEVPVAEYQQAVTDMLANGVEDLGLSMNTAREATETLTGSMAMTKAAWKNLVVGFADPDADIGNLISKFTESAKASFSNIMPTVIQALGGIGEFIEQIAPEISAALPEIIESTLPSLLSAGTSIVTSLVSAVTKSIPTLAPMAKQLLVSIKDAIVKNAPVVIGGFSDLLRKGVDWLAENLPNIIAAGKEIVSAIGQGISDNIGEIWASLQGLGQLLWDNVIVPAWDWVVYKLPVYINSTLKSIDFFKLASDISSLIIKGLEGIADFVSAIDWDEVGADIGDFLNGIDWHGILEALFKVIGAVLSAAPEFLEGIIRELNFESAAGLIALLFVPKIMSHIASSILANGATAAVSAAFQSAFAPIAVSVGAAMGLLMLGEIASKIKGISLEMNEQGVISLTHSASASKSASQNRFLNAMNSTAGENKDGTYNQNYASYGVNLSNADDAQAAWEKQWGKSSDETSDFTQSRAYSLLSKWTKSDSSGFFNAASEMEQTRKAFHAGGGIFRGVEHIFGEAGDEAVIPLENDERGIRQIADAISSNMFSAPVFNVTVNVSETIDNIDDIGIVVVEKIDEALQDRNIMQSRSSGGTGWK